MNGLNWEYLTDEVLFPLGFWRDTDNNYERFDDNYAIYVDSDTGRLTAYSVSADVSINIECVCMLDLERAIKFFFK